jgi:F0F1-type ATP synthase epsilon subunit
VALVPKEPGSVPVYSPDAEVFVGTLEQAQSWADGVIWARQYDEMLSLSNDKKRAQKELAECNRQERARAKARHAAEQKQIVQILKS